MARQEIVAGLTLPVYVNEFPVRDYILGGPVYVNELSTTSTGSSGSTAPVSSGVFTVGGPGVACNYGLSGWWAISGFNGVSYPFAPLSGRSA